MTINEYAKLMQKIQILSNELNDLKDKLIFINFRLVSKHYDKFHLRSFINFVLNTSPELLESCRTSEGGSDYVCLNGSKEDLTAMIELTLHHFKITEDHCLYNGFQLLLKQINEFNYNSTIFVNDKTMSDKRRDALCELCGSDDESVRESCNYDKKYTCLSSMLCDYCHSKYDHTLYRVK